LAADSLRGLNRNRDDADVDVMAADEILQILSRLYLEASHDVSDLFRIALDRTAKEKPAFLKSSIRQKGRSQVSHANKNDVPGVPIDTENPQQPLAQPRDFISPAACAKLSEVA